MIILYCLILTNVEYVNLTAGRTKNDFIHSLAFFSVSYHFLFLFILMCVKHSSNPTVLHDTVA